MNNYDDIKTYNCYENDFNLSKNYDRAIHLYKNNYIDEAIKQFDDLAKIGHIESNKFLSSYYRMLFEKNLFNTELPDDALSDICYNMHKYALNAAELEDVEACFYLYELLSLDDKQMNPISVNCNKFPKGIRDSIYWLKIAAKKEHALALEKLGDEFYFAWNLDVNRLVASILYVKSYINGNNNIEILLRASYANNLRAQYLLGIYYLEVLGSFEEGTYWLTVSAAQGNMNSFNYLIESIGMIDSNRYIYDFIDTNLMMPSFICACMNINMLPKQEKAEYYLSLKKEVKLFKDYLQNLLNNLHLKNKKESKSIIHKLTEKYPLNFYFKEWMDNRWISSPDLEDYDLYNLDSSLEHPEDYDKAHNDLMVEVSMYEIEIQNFG